MKNTKNINTRLDLSSQRGVKMKKGDTKAISMKNELKKAQKDPKFMKDIRKFIKITTGVYKLKDYGLEKIGLD